MICSCSCSVLSTSACSCPTSHHIPFCIFLASLHLACVALCLNWVQESQSQAVKISHVAACTAQPYSRTAGAYSRTAEQPDKLNNSFILKMQATMMILLVVAVASMVPASLACDGAATYKVTFSGIWDKSRTVRKFPSDPHWSPLVPTNHKKNFRLFREAKQATPGLVTVAEIGAPTTLVNELKSNQRVKTAVVGNVHDSPGTQTVMIRVSEGYPFISGVSMMAPSPDWFAGFRVKLCRRGEWRQRRSGSGHLYDAGSDSGKTFNSRDKATNPQADVSRITSSTGNKDFPFYKPSKPIPQMYKWKAVRVD
eukprot:m.10004 g.10004  ORF g.10004 m.10004 type:complete len:310 (-) comp3656_c0_seq2:162-1091(-)